MNNFVNSIIIICLMIVIFLQTCGKNNTVIKETPIHYRDTSYVKISGDTTINNFHVVKTIPYLITSKDTQYLPSKDYDSLKKQYEELRDSLLATKVYNDTYKIATVGNATVKTTLFKNNIIHQDFNYNIKYPIIKDSVVIPAPQKTQVYFGIGLLGNQKELIKGAEINLSLKNKKDQIFEGKYQIINGESIYGIGTKWKIKL